MPADNPPRWITIHQPFDYRWPDRSALTAFSEAGEFMVKGEVADFAVAQGFASEGKARDSKSKSAKARRTRKRTAPRKAAKPVADAAPADLAADNGLDGAGLAGDDRADIRPGPDQDAG